MPWDDILRKGKSRRTGQTIDNSHPNTSTITMWNRYRAKTITWIHENESILDYFKFSKGSGSMKSLLNKVGTEFKLGEHKPERRLNYIKEISRLMYIMGKSERFDFEVTLKFWGAYEDYVEGLKIWEHQPKKDPGDIWKQDMLKAVRYFKGRDIPDNLFDLWMRSSMLLFMSHIDEINDAMGPNRAANYLGKISAGHTQGTKTPTKRPAIILNTIRVFPPQIKLVGNATKSMQALYIEMVEAMFPRPKWTINWGHVGIEVKETKTSSKSPPDIWRKAMLKRHFAKPIRISRRMWEKWFRYTDDFINKNYQLLDKPDLLLTDSLREIFRDGILKRHTRPEGVTTMVKLMTIKGDSKLYMSHVRHIFRHVYGPKAETKNEFSRMAKPPGDIWRKAILKRIQGLPKSSYELQSHWYHITRLWLQSPMGQRIDDFDFGDEDWRTDQPRAALEYITHNHKRLHGGEEETDKMIRAAMRNLTINGDRKPYTRFLMENLPYYDYELGHLDMSDPKIMDRAAEYLEDNSPSIWGKVESVRGDD